MVRPRCPYFTSFALSVIFGPASAFETGQSFFSSFGIQAKNRKALWSNAYRRILSTTTRRPLLLAADFAIFVRWGVLPIFTQVHVK
jgi:hypothetical protein